MTDKELKVMFDLKQRLLKHVSIFFNANQSLPKMSKTCGNSKGNIVCFALTFKPLKPLKPLNFIAFKQFFKFSQRLSKTSQKLFLTIRETFELQSI